MHILGPQHDQTSLGIIYKDSYIFMAFKSFITQSTRRKSCSFSMNFCKVLYFTCLQIPKSSITSEKQKYVKMKISFSNKKYWL